MSAIYGQHLTRESRVIVLGLPRYGKTTLIRDVLTRDCTRVIWHDVLGHDYYARGRLMLSIDELEEHAYLLEHEHCRIVVKCADPGDPEIVANETERIIDLVYPSPGNIALVFDERGRTFRKDEKRINNLFASGSHYGIATIVAAQKATDLGVGTRTSCSDCYAYGQHHHIELKGLYDCYGDRFAAFAATAPKYKYAHWTEEKREQWWTPESRSKFAAITPRVAEG